MIVCADDISFLRTINEPKRNIGPRRIKMLKEYSQSHNCSLYKSLIENIEEPLIIKTKATDFVGLIENYKQIYKELTMSDLLARVLNDSGYEEMLRLMGDRLDNIAELKQSVVTYENFAGEDESLEDYLSRVALFTNLDNEDKKERVKLMTIHTAKGLEFPNVFVCGLNEGIFPSKRTDTKEKLEEERRLAYVAFTRAEEKLFLSESEGTNNEGGFRYPSRFIFNIEKELLQYLVELNEDLINATNVYIDDDESKYNLESSFKVGDVIVHKVFGQGKIVELDIENKLYMIKFDNIETVRSISFDVQIEVLKDN